MQIRIHINTYEPVFHVYITYVCDVNAYTCKSVKIYINIYIYMRESYGHSSSVHIFIYDYVCLKGLDHSNDLHLKDSSA